MSQARLGHLYLVHSAKTRQETFFFKASHEPLMGNCKMLCQTSTNGRCLSLAPLKCCHWVGGIKKLKRGRGSKSTKDKQWNNESSAPVLAVEGHFADCVPWVPVQEDRPLCCRSLVPLNSLFQLFFAEDRSQEALPLPGLPRCDWRPPSVPMYGGKYGPLSDPF